MFKIIFFWPAASMLFTFSRSALLSSPNTTRPSSSITLVPSTSRLVIFNATAQSPFLLFQTTGAGSTWSPRKYRVRPPQFLRSVRGSIVVRARHVIATNRAQQLALARLQPPGTHRAIAGRRFLRGADLFFAVRRAAVGLRPGKFHGRGYSTTAHDKAKEWIETQRRAPSAVFLDATAMVGGTSIR